MVRIVYGYYRRSENFNFTTGSPIIEYVDGETVKQVNNAYRSICDNHDLSKYTPTRFWKVEEIEEH